VKKLTFLFVLIAHISTAQSSSLAGIIKQIDFQEDTIKSVFDWVANHIKYDVAKAQENARNGKSPQTKKHKTRSAYQQDKLEKVIRRKKGVCEDYSLLFDAIVSELGYQSYIIRGCTKDKEGKIRGNTGHTWNTVKVNGVWKLYDPTWGAGFIKDKTKFIKRYSIEWYDVSPEEMIKNHLPFDPMWQLSDQPISYKDFEKNENTAQARSPYDYEALINAYFLKGEKEQMKEQLERSKEMEVGKGINRLDKWRKTLSKNIDLYDYRRQSDLMAEANKKGKESTEVLNEYRTAKNKHFKHKKWTLEYSQQALLKAKEEMTIALATFQSVEVEDPKVKSNLKRFISQSEGLLKKINAELKYLDKKLN